MKIHYLIIGLLLVIILSACQSQQPVAPDAEQTLTPEAYPAPGQTPDTAPVQPKSGGEYPPPQEGEFISWERAVFYIQNDQISKIIIINSPNLTLITKDGRNVYTSEPSSGALQELIKQCGDPCKLIILE